MISISATRIGLRTPFRSLVSVSTLHKLECITFVCKWNCKWPYQEIETNVTSSAPRVRQPKNASHHNDASGRSSPFDSLIYDETDAISCQVKNGYLLVITNIWDLQHPEPRYGAKEDSEEVEKFFVRAGFTVEKLFNQSKYQMQQEFHKLSKKDALRHYDCFALVIMSHGGEKGILGTCGESYDVDEIVDFFKGDRCPVLITKPKLFFIQACRGSQNDPGQLPPQSETGDCVDGKPLNDKIKNPIRSVPTDSDILVVYSTTKGRPAYRCVDYSSRRPKGGSWFITCLTKVFHEYGDKEDLMTMMVRVNRALSKYGDVHKQIPCQVSMLTKKIYFTLDKHLNHF